MSGCLIEGTNGEFSNFLIKNNDLGLFTEVEMLFHSTVSIADSIGRIHAKKIIPFTYGDGKKKIPIFSECVRYALSKRTTAYALYGKTEFEAAEKGESDVTMIGVRHTF